MKKFRTADMVKIALLSAVAYSLSLLKLPTFQIFPEFLKLELGDIPAVLAAITLGPAAGIAVEAIKNLLACLIAPNGKFIGEFANFVIGASYVGTLGLIYKNKKNIQAFTIGAITATFVMAAVGCLMNYYVFIPVYAWILNVEPQLFVDIASAVNSRINSFAMLIVLAILPFNLLKGVLVSVLGYLIYRVLKPIINRF